MRFDMGLSKLPTAAFILLNERADWHSHGPGDLN